MPIANINGININYKIEGQGEPLIIIQGLGMDKSGSNAQLPAFKKHYQVVTFDNRGVGTSDKPAGPYTTRMMADDTIGLMDHLGLKKANILGISMGGMIAQEIAINYPERVSKLILACTYACNNVAPSGATPEWVHALELHQQGKIGPMISLMCEKNLYKIIFWFIMKIQNRHKGASDAAAFVAQAAACATHQTLDRLSLIKSPTLIMVGTKDRVLKPTSSEVIAERIPGAKLVKVEGGSHAFPLR